MKQQVSNLLIAGLGVSLLSATAAYPQALNPPYLAEMPVPARVIAEIKGKDAEDTGERQMGALIALIQIMDEMAWGIGHRYVNDADTTRITPDERRIRLAYQTAYAELWHKVKNKEGHVYDHDRALLTEILNKFFSENFRTLYSKSNANAAAGSKAFHEKMYSNPSNTASTQPANQTASPGSTAELRRCIASGRSTRICFKEVMGTGFAQIVGTDLRQPVPSGLRMTGDYASNGGFRLIFRPEEATMVCRGVPSPRSYTIQITDTQTLVSVQNQPKALVFSLNPDGKLAGAGSVRVTGQVPSGSHSEQTMGMTTQKTTSTKEVTGVEAQRNFATTEAWQRAGQSYTVQEDATQLVYGPTGTRTITDFTTKTADCTLGLMSPIGASPLPHLPKDDIGILTTLGSGLGVLMKGGNLNAATKEMISPDDVKHVAPGLRFSGRYSGESGFGLTFHNESVTVACSDAERALEYSVQRAGTKAMLVIKDNPNPISLTLMPDGSLTGEGTVQVNGRVITGTTDDANNPFVFAPHVARCPLSRLVAGSSASKPSAIAAPAAPAPVLASASSASVGSSAAPVGGASLKISAGPGVSSLLAGKALIVLKDSLESVLATAGISAQAGSSRISAWARACERSSRDAICQQGGSGVGNYLVARTGFDGTGMAVFNNVPSSGSFYVVTETPSTHHLIWNLKVDLKPGANSLTVDERNATPIDR